MLRLTEPNEKITYQQKKEIKKRLANELGLDESFFWPEWGKISFYLELEKEAPHIKNWKSTLSKVAFRYSHHNGKRITRYVRVKDGCIDISKLQKKLTEMKSIQES